MAYGLWSFSMAFLVGRHLVRVMVERKINDYPKFKAVDAAIEDEGWKVVDLLRPSPTVPFSLQNWFLGTTKVGFLPYVVATFAGIMPGTLLYVWIGSLGANAGGEGPTAKYILFGVGLIATLAVTILVGRKAKAKLDEHA